MENAGCCCSRRLASDVESRTSLQIALSVTPPQEVQATFVLTYSGRHGHNLGGGEGVGNEGCAKEGKQEDAWSGEP